MSQANIDLAKKGQKNSTACGHFMPVWDNHKYWFRCGENLGTDACVVLGKESCDICTYFTTDQKTKLHTRENVKEEERIIDYFGERI